MFGIFKILAKPGKAGSDDNQIILISLANREIVRDIIAAAKDGHGTDLPALHSRILDCRETNPFQRVTGPYGLYHQIRENLRCTLFYKGGEVDPSPEDMVLVLEERGDGNERYDIKRILHGEKAFFAAAITCPDGHQSVVASYVSGTESAHKTAMLSGSAHVKEIAVGVAMSELEQKQLSEAYLHIANIPHQCGHNLNEADIQPFP